MLGALINSNFRADQENDKYFTSIKPIQPPSASLWHTARQVLGYNVLSPFFSLVSTIWMYTVGRYVYIKQTRLAYEESANMKFVRRTTSIPAPRVYAVFHIPPWAFFWRRRWHWGKAVPYTSDAYIFMQRIDGEPLDVWTWTSFDDPTRNRIISQLRQFVAELRAIQTPPLTVVGSVNGGPVSDNRLDETWTSTRSEISGPYQAEYHLNSVLRRHRPLTEFGPTVVESHTRSHPIVFTHGNIDMHNIMVKDGEVVAIIDWASSGWFPTQWEYLKAHWVPIVYDEEMEWRRRLPEIMPEYELERLADNDLIRQLGN